MPPHVSGAIRGWHHGRIRAMRSARARELLTKLMPAILEALAATADPDAAFAQFDRFLSNLPSGVQLFSLFLARPEFLELLAQVVGSAPRLAAASGAHARHLGRAAGCRFPEHACRRAPQLDGQSRSASLSGAYEEQLDGARRFAREENFRVGVQIGGRRGQGRAGRPGLCPHRRKRDRRAVCPWWKPSWPQAPGRVPGADFAVIAHGQAGRARNDRQLRSRSGVRL